MGAPYIFIAINLIAFLKVMFLHLDSEIRTKWSIVLQFSDDFLMYIPIYDIYRAFTHYKYYILSFFCRYINKSDLITVYKNFLRILIAFFSSPSYIMNKKGEKGEK